MVRVYGQPNSRSLRVVWALEECGAPYDYVKVDLFAGAGRAPAYLAINAAGKVPALVDGERCITESGAILIHIGERCPAAGLLPGTDHPGERAGVFEWMFFVATELEQPLWTLAKHRFALPKERRVADIEATARWEFERAARVAEARLGARTHAVGEAFTLADILLGHTLAWAHSARLEGIPPALAAYLERVYARPARLRADARERAA